MRNLPWAGNRGPFVLAAALALFAGACDDDWDDAEPWDGETSVGDGWLHIHEPVEELTYSTSGSTVTLRGHAYIGAWSYPIISTEVFWENHTTGESGAAVSDVEWIFFFGYYPGRHNWSATIPLAPGENEIVVTAWDFPELWGSDLIRITRLP